jgi:hypothetical protein
VALWGQVPLPIPFNRLTLPAEERPANWEISIGGSPLLWGDDGNGHAIWLRGADFSISHHAHINVFRHRVDYRAGFDDGILFGPAAIIEGTGTLHVNSSLWSFGAETETFRNLKIDLGGALGASGINLSTSSLLPGIYSLSQIPTFRANLPVNEFTAESKYQLGNTEVGLRGTLRNDQASGRIPSVDLESSTAFPLFVLPSTYRLEATHSFGKGLELLGSWEAGGRGFSGTFAGSEGTASTTSRYQHFDIALKSSGPSLGFESGAYSGATQGVLENAEELGLGLPPSIVSYADSLGVQWSTLSYTVPMRARQADSALTASYSWVNFSVSGSYDIFALIVNAGGDAGYSSGTHRVLGLKYEWSSRRRPGPFFSVEDLVPLSFSSHGGGNAESASSGSSARIYGGLMFRLGLRF